MKKMKFTIRGVVMLGILTMMSLNLWGCVMAAIGSSMHDKDISTFPTYAETKAVWGAIPDGYGRVVIFFEKLGAYGKGSETYVIKVDQLPKTQLVDQTFVFIDLPAGKHSIVQEFWPFSRTWDVDVQPGEISYKSFGGKNLSKEFAETQLENIRHYYRQPLPFDKQGASVGKERVKEKGQVSTFDKLT